MHTPSYVTVGCDPWGIATDGSMVYVASGSDSKLYYFPTSSPPSTASYVSTGSGTEPAGVALTPDGSKIYVGDDSTNQSTLVYATGSPPSYLRTISGTGGNAVGMFIQQNQYANTPFIGGTSSSWFGC